MAEQKIKVILWLILLCTNTGCMANDQAIRVLRSSPKVQCDFDTVLPSGNGVDFSLYRSNARFQEAPALTQPDWFVVYSTMRTDLPISKPAELEPAIVGGVPMRLRPLAWQAGTLTFRIGTDRLGSYVPASGSALEIQSLPAVWTDFEIHILKADEISALFDPIIIEQARLLSEDDRYLRKTVYVSESPIFSVVEQGSGQILKVGRSEEHLQEFGSASFYNHFRSIDIGGTDEVYFLGQQRADLRNQLSDYSRAFFNYVDGKSGGYFRPDSVIGVPAEEHINSVIKQNNFLIRDAALSGENLFLLLDNQAEISVLIVDPTNGDIVSEVQVCEIDAALAGLFPDLRDQIERGPRRHFLEIGVQLDPQSEATGVLVKNKASPSDRLVVYFHGGPAQTANPYHLGPEKRALLDDGYDLLMVDYSGSVGGGLALSRGLQDGIASGFRRDAKAISTWLAARGYESVHLYAVSFGTLPALILATDFPEHFDKKIFVGPLLSYPGASLLGGSEDLLDQTVVGGQEDFEKGLFGGINGRKRYAAFIEQTSSAYRPDDRDLFVFGSADRKTPKSSAPPNILEAGNIYEVEKVGHSFLPSDELTIKRIRCHLSEDCLQGS